MITDKETNVVYLSPWLNKYHPEFFQEFKLLLERTGIPVEILENTADMWCRDYMPIQISDNKFVQYRYYPDYLRKGKSDLKYITDTDIVCSNM
ncbi:MAG: hypothetical protein Q4D41_08160, partial [Prevotellaceae bacterium]|nr:hypothetical protein [Prevotellaceae bacterium]